MSGEVTLRERIANHRGQLLGLVTAGLDGVLDDTFVCRLLDEHSHADGADVAGAAVQLVLALLDELVAVADIHRSDVVARRIALQRLALGLPIVTEAGEER